MALISPITPANRFRRNLLAVPFGVKPGYDPSHPAVGRVTRFSGVAVAGGEFLNILTNKLGTRVGSPTVSVNSLGLTVNSADSTANYITFTGNPAVQDTIQTIAMICIPKVLGNYCITSSDATNGIMILDVGGFWSVENGAGSGTATTIPIVLNVPVFVATSINATGTIRNMVVRRLDNGQLYATTGTNGPPQAGAGNGTYGICGDTFGDAGSIAIATWMFSAGKLMSMAELIRWAQDPWAFWYPQALDYPSLWVGSKPSLPWEFEPYSAQKFIFTQQRRASGGSPT
jgi:hypothetical protein